jgi:hypothetical protein
MAIWYTFRAIRYSLWPFGIFLDCGKLHQEKSGSPGGLLHRSDRPKSNAKLVCCTNLMCTAAEPNRRSASRWPASFENHKKFFDLNWFLKKRRLRTPFQAEITMARRKMGAFLHFSNLLNVFIHMYVRSPGRSRWEKPICMLWSSIAGLPDISLFNIPKTGENIPKCH